MPLLFKRFTILPLLALFILSPECVAAKGPAVHNGGIYSAPSDPAEAVAVFYFSPQNTTFWAYYGDNYKTIGEFAKVVEANREDILSGRALIRINGYSSSMPTARENLKIAKIRTNHVKSWYIITAGLEEKHFKTYNSARPWNGRSEITAVMYLEWVDGESKPAGEGEKPGDGQKEDGAGTEPQTGTGITEGAQTPAPTDKKADGSHGDVAAEPLDGEKEPTTDNPVTVIPPGQPARPDSSSNEVETGDEQGGAGVLPGDRGTITSPEVSPSGVKPRSGGTKPFIAVKTNALLLAGILPDFRSYTFVPNLGLEWYFADRWSLAASGAYRKGWAGSGKYFGVSAWSLEPRLWLGGDGRFRGLFVGIYALAGDFDNQNIHSSHYKTGSYFGGGLSLGGYVPLWRNLGIEASVSGGYLSREIDFYSHMAPNYYRDYTEKKGKFGLTNVNISVVYRFNKSSK